MSHPSISFRQEFIDLHPVPWLDLWGHELLVRRAWIAAVTDAHFDECQTSFPAKHKIRLHFQGLPGTNPEVEGQLSRSMWNLLQRFL